MKPLPPPPFEIPLSDEELILLGKIAVLWGQIDEAVNRVLRWTLKLSPAMFDRTLGNQMIGSRVGHFKTIAADVSRQAVKALLLEIEATLTRALHHRNAAMHSCWGRFVLDQTFLKTRVGIFSHQKPEVRFYNSDINNLYFSLSGNLILLYNLLMLSTEENPEPVDYKDNKVYFTPEYPDENCGAVTFKQGDKVYRVGSKPRGWHKR